MKRKPKFVTVTPVDKKTGNKAPSIGTNVTYSDIGTLSDTDAKRAIEEAKSLSRLSDIDNWDFQIKENSDSSQRRVK